MTGKGKFEHVIEASRRAVVIFPSAREAAEFLQYLDDVARAMFPEFDAMFQVDRDLLSTVTSDPKLHYLLLARLNVIFDL